MKKGEVDAACLELNQEEVWRSMGIMNNNPDELAIRLSKEMTDEVRRVARPSFAYTFIKDTDFRYGKIIREGLNNAEYYVIVVSTLGKEVDDLIHHYQETDMVNAFAANAVASELAEAVQRIAIHRIESELPSEDKLSNPYSPGYCGWMLKEQRKLFAYFDESPCGIQLTDSCLMLPIKSISSLLAIGKQVKKTPYGCSVCEKTDCYKKRK